MIRFSNKKSDSFTESLKNIVLFSPIGGEFALVGCGYSPPPGEYGQRPGGGGKKTPDKPVLKFTQRTFLIRLT